MEHDYLVLVQGTRGPQCQLWSDEVRTGNSELQPHIWLKPLDNDEKRLDLTTLAKRYAFV